MKRSKEKRIDVELRPFMIKESYQKCRHYEHYVVITRKLVKCTRCGVLIVIGAR